MAPTPEMHAAVEGCVTVWREAIAPWESRHTYMNFAESRRDARSLFSEQAYHRLRRIKAKVLITMDRLRGLDYPDCLDRIAPGWETSGGGSALPQLQQIFVRAFKNGAWKTQGQSLNIDQGKRPRLPRSTSPARS